MTNTIDEELSDLGPWTPEEHRAHPLMRRIAQTLLDAFKQAKNPNWHQLSESWKTPLDWVPNGGISIPALTAQSQTDLTQLVGYNPARYQVQINNIGGHALVICKSRPSTGITLAATTGTITIRTKGSIFCYSTLGTTVDIIESVFAKFPKIRHADNVGQDTQGFGSFIEG